MKRTKRLRKNKRRRYTKSKRSVHGGNSDYITAPSKLIKQHNYLIKFYNDEDNDEVELEFSPNNNGIYKYINSVKLWPYNYNRGVSYYIFERNGIPIYLFDENNPITYNNITTQFLMPVYYDNTGTLVSEKPNYLFSDDYYYEIRPIRYRCNVYKTYTTTDLTNVSRISRLKKNLPIEMERSIQSFMVGKTKYDK